MITLAGWIAIAGFCFLIVASFYLGSALGSAKSYLEGYEEGLQKGAAIIREAWGLDTSTAAFPAAPEPKE